MFKELKVIKLLVILGLLITLFFSIKPEKLAGLYIVSKNSSYSNGDTLTVYFKTGKPIHYSGDIAIQNIITEKIVHEIHVNFENEAVVESSVIENGFGKGYSVQIVLDESFDPGIYSIDNKTTFIVSNTEECDITVVYPYISTLLTEPYNDVNALNGNVNVVSKSRSVSLDKYTSNWAPFFQWLDENYKVNYISDLQLEVLSNYDKSKCIFIYGNSGFWTRKMKDSYLQFVENGGNSLVASTYLINNAIWNDLKKNRLSFSETGNQAGFNSWGSVDGSSVLKEVGMSYTIGSMGITTSEYAVNDSQHELFKGVTDTILSISLANFVGYPVSNKNTYNEVFNYHATNLLATTRYQDSDDRTQGILELKKDSLSGIIISLGTGDWGDQDEFKNKGSLFKIAQNGIAYLLQF